MQLSISPDFPENYPHLYAVYHSDNAPILYYLVPTYALPLNLRIKPLYFLFVFLIGCRNCNELYCSLKYAKTDYLRCSITLAADIMKKNMVKSGSCEIDTLIECV